MRKRFLSMKLLSVMLSASLAFTSVQWGTIQTVKAAEPIKIAENVEMDTENGSDDKDLQWYYYVDDGDAVGGFQKKKWVDENGNDVDVLPEESKDNELSQASDVTYPSKYSMVDENLVPEIRNQGKWGTCWAHGSIAAAETSMIKQGYADTSVNYSERHLAYFGHHKDPILEDGADSKDDTYGWYGGGAPETAISMFASWYGPAQESDYQYNSYGNMEDLADSAQTDCAAHLRNTYEIDHTDIDGMKEAIVNNGALVCAYYDDNDSLSDGKNIYHANMSGVNHVVSIVGWDDDYAASNFSGSPSGETPKGNGAWLIRNSWGTSQGDKGYYWMSYEESTLCSIYSFQMDKADNYDNIYQYDGRGYTGYTSYGVLKLKGANIFKATSLESIKAVSFYTLEDSDYEIEVYVGNDMKNPEDGYLVTTQRGTVNKNGYHTVDLEKSVTVGEGEQYSIILSTKGNDQRYLTFIDSYADAGQSYLNYGNGWEEAKRGTANVNVCVKAFTDNVESVSKDGLKALIDEAETKNEADYTSTSWAAYMIVVDAVKEVYNKESATNKEIVDAINIYENAVNKLVAFYINVYTPQDIERIASDINNNFNTYEESVIRLKNDIDMSGLTHTAIGNYSYMFNTTFDGCGYKIKNLTYENDYSYAGFFGQIGEKGIVKNLTIENTAMNMKGTYSGGIAGTNSGTIENSGISGEIKFGSSCAGGIAGTNGGTIRNCTFDGTLTCEASGTNVLYQGGLAGVNYDNATIENCNVTGEVTINGSDAGGITGSNGGMISNCTFDGTLTYKSSGADVKEQGGIVGVNESNGTIENCDITGTITLDSYTTGGIAGYNSGIIKKCNNKSTTTFGSYNAGGIAGYNNGTIGNCALDGTLTFTLITEDNSGKNQGGIVAENYGTIEGCSTSGIIDLKGSIPIGGIAGLNSYNKKISRCYNLAEIKGDAEGDNETAGLVCENYGTLSECYNIGSITRKDGGNNYAMCVSMNAMPANVYYLDTSCAKGTIFQNESNWKRTKEEFESGQVAYELNTANGTTDNSLVWSMDNKIPVLADDTHKGIVKLSVSQGADSNATGKINGVSEGNIYVEAGSEVKVDIPDADEPGMIQASETTGLIATDTPNVYKVPDKDGNVVITVVKRERNKCTVHFSDNPGINCSAVEGYDNTCVYEGDAFEFTVAEVEGYDISNAIVKYGNTVLEPNAGKYRINSVTAVDSTITVENVVIKNPSYLINDNENYKGYVGVTASLKPGKKYSGIKLKDEKEYVDEINVDTDKSVEIQICDEYGNISEPVTVEFIRDIDAPEITGVTAEYVDPYKTYKGVNITVNANDTASGVKEYSFDNGKTWQESNVYIVAGSENAEKYSGVICVKDVAGNVAKYDKELIIPAVEKSATKITMSIDKESAVYGDKITLTAVVEFEAESEGGKITFKDQDGKVISTLEVVMQGVTTGYSQLVIDTATFEKIGKYGYTAIYDGTGTKNKDAESDICECDIKKATVVSVLGDWSFNKEISASDNYTKDMIDNYVKSNDNIAFVTDSGIECVLQVNWSTTASYNAKGAEYNYLAVVSGNDMIQISDSLKLEAKVTVTPVNASNPQWNVVYIEQGEGIKDAAALGEEYLPTSGNITVNGNTISYVITWDSDKSIDISDATADVIFTGKISYIDAPDWVTLPEVNTVTREVKVKEKQNVDPGDDNPGDDDPGDDDPYDDDPYDDEIDAPLAPASLKATKVSKSSIQIKWSRVSDADGYIIYRKTGSGSYKQCKIITSNKTTSYKDTKLKTTGKYSYKVMSYALGWYDYLFSDYSSAKSIDMNKYLSADELKISSTKLSLKVKKNKTLKVVYPKGRKSSQISSIKYSSSKKGVAKVSSKGKVTAVKKGKATIKIVVKLKNGQSKTLKTAVTVK